MPEETAVPEDAEAKQLARLGDETTSPLIRESIRLRAQADEVLVQIHDLTGEHLAVLKEARDFIYTELLLHTVNVNPDFDGHEALAHVLADLDNQEGLVYNNHPDFFGEATDEEMILAGKALGFNEDDVKAVIENGDAEALERLLLSLEGGVEKNV